VSHRAAGTRLAGQYGFIIPAGRDILPREPFAVAALHFGDRRQGAGKRMRKLIAFDDDTFDKLKQLARDRMGTLQELADEAFADLLKKHGIPVDLKDALRKSASIPNTAVQDNAKSGRSGKTKS
jgi:hypothetical protein